MATQTNEPRPYLSALRRVILAMPGLPREDRDIMLLALKQRARHADNQKQWRRRGTPARTPAQQAAKTAYMRRWRAAKKAASAVSA
jgi:hypothetical protein